MTVMVELNQAVDLLQPHVVAVALVSARLLPVAFFCPLLGGSHAPVHVKLGLVLALAVSLHFAAGVTPSAQVGSALDYAAIALRELVFGTTLGLIASLPFDAARMGGRFIDLFRGSSAEASLPLAGTKESATGDALYHLLLALSSAGIAMPLVLGALWKSFAVVQLGTFVHTESATMQVVGLVGSAMATGLAIGAPIAGVSLGVDAVLGLASRAAPQMNLQETSAPLRILAGGAVTWLAIGLISGRLIDLVSSTPDAMARLFALAQ